MMRRAHHVLLHVENVLHDALVRHSVVALRLALGAIFLGFGVLKFFPGVSPAEDLTVTTIDLLALGLVPGSVAIVAVGALEGFIGICMLSGRWMRPAIWLLTIQLVGVLAPLVLLPERLVAGPGGAPTLEGQYVLKDLILVGAAMVIAAASFRGGRLVRSDLPPASSLGGGARLDGEQKARIVLDAASDEALIRAICERHGVTESEFHEWRDATLKAASRALA